MRAKKQQTKYLCYLALVILAALLLICTFLCIRIGLRNRAEEHVRLQEYSEALRLYEKLRDEEMLAHVNLLILERDYMDACMLMENGEYERAKEAFIGLTDYSDSTELAKACDYLRACELIDAGEFFEAHAVLEKVSEEYPGRGEAMKEIYAGIRLQSIEFARKGNYAGAAEALEQIVDYKDCDKLLLRCERMRIWLEGDERVIYPECPRLNDGYRNVYVNEHAYVVVPETYDENCNFLLYYPGGMDYELNVDFLYTYVENPAPNTFAVFMRRNGIEYMEEKNSQALEILDRVAAECGVFMQNIVVVGSSMGAYPAAHSARLSMKELGVNVECVLALDAGGDWGYKYALRESDCVETAKIGTEFYIFESPGNWRDHPPIKLMVENGMNVTMVACYFDEHERMTYDAMGMGVLHWAVGDRTQPCLLNIYTFKKLEI